MSGDIEINANIWSKTDWTYDSHSAPGMQPNWSKVPLPYEVNSNNALLLYVIHQFNSKYGKYRIWTKPKRQHYSLWSIQSW